MTNSTTKPPNAGTTPPEEITHLSALVHDANNANKGTARGLDMLRDSLERLGAGRSIVLDREGRIVAGNKTATAAALAGMEDIIVVRTDGSRIVAVQRMDLDLDSPEGRELAIADNRVGEIGLSWDAEVLAGLQTSLDLSGLFSGAEINTLLGELSKAPDLGALTAYGDAPQAGAVGPDGRRIDWQRAASASPAESEQGPNQAPDPGSVPATGAAGRPLGPQGAPPPMSIRAAEAPSAPPVEFKEFDESVADGVVVHQCPACGNRWAE